MSAAIVTAGLVMIGSGAAPSAATRAAPAAAPGAVLDGGVPLLPPDAGIPPAPVPTPADAGATADAPAGPIPGRDAGATDAGAPPVPRDAGASPSRPRV